MRAVDLFAGLGGFTAAARAAGLVVTHAVNHWPTAIEAHELAHPEVTHHREDALLVSPDALGDFEVLLASPACQGHSRARGTDRPEHDAMRSTADAVPRLAELARPRLIVVENVPEFLRWSGFLPWVLRLRRAGYQVSARVLSAAGFGVAQERERLFVVALANGRRVRLREERPRAEAPGALTLLDPEAPLSPVRTPRRAPATLRRIERARAEVGPTFVMPYYGSGSGLTGRSLERPLGTVTTRARWALVEGDRMRMLSPRECARAQGFPDAYPLRGPLARQHHLVGNAVPPPMAASVLRQALEAA